MKNYRIVEEKTKEVDWVSRAGWKEETIYYVQVYKRIGWFDIGCYPSEQLARESIELITTRRIINI